MTARLRFVIWPRAPAIPSTVTVYTQSKGGCKLSNGDRESTLAYLREEVRKRQTEVAELEIRLIESTRALDTVRSALKLLSPVPVDDVDGDHHSFFLHISKTCMEYGHFNVPTALGHHLAQEGPVTLTVDLNSGGGVQQLFQCTIRRYDNRNGQPRIKGGRDLKQYFRHIQKLSPLKVEIVTPHDLRLTIPPHRLQDGQEN